MSARINEKDRNVFIGIAVTAIVTGVLVFFSGANTIPNTSPEVRVASVVVPFTKLAQGVQAGVPIRINYLIKSSVELNQLWKIIAATGTPPTVDFKTQAVIAVFAGKESTSSISIAKIEDSDARVVSVLLTKLEGPCAKKVVTESPYEIAVVPASPLPLTHEDISTIVSCPK